MDFNPANLFRPAITDSGLCHVYNGAPMLSTYGESARMDELSSALDRRRSSRADKINGTGTGHRKTFWLNIGDR